MRLVYLESPFAGDVMGNITYARRCMADCLSRGEAPFASHLLYTQEGVLRDSIEAERNLGINAGFAWARFAGVSVFYVDRGISGGMKRGLDNARRGGRRIEYRALDKKVCAACGLDVSDVPPEEYVFDEMGRDFCSADHCVEFHDPYGDGPQPRFMHRTGKP